MTNVTNFGDLVPDEVQDLIGQSWKISGVTYTVKSACPWSEQYVMVTASNLTDDSKPLLKPISVVRRHLELMASVIPDLSTIEPY